MRCRYHYEGPSKLGHHCRACALTKKCSIQNRCNDYTGMYTEPTAHIVELLTRRRSDTHIGDFESQ